MTTNNLMMNNENIDLKIIQKLINELQFNIEKHLLQNKTMAYINIKNILTRKDFVTGRLIVINDVYLGRDCIQTIKSK